MKTYELKLVLGGVSDFSDDQGDSLHRSVCDDGTIATRDGTVFIRLSRESSSLEDAINSAAANVENAGFSVEHIEVHCLV